MTPVTKQISIDAIRKVFIRSEQEIDHFGNKWVQNNPDYVEFCKKGDKILHNTGKLLYSIKTEGFGNEVVLYTTKVKYAHTMQYGAVLYNVKIPYRKRTRPQKYLFFKKLRIPARPFLGYDIESIASYKKMIKDFLIGIKQ